MNLLIASDLHLESLRNTTRTYNGSSKTIIKRMERRRALAREHGINIEMIMNAGFMLNVRKADLIILAGDIGLGVDGVAWAIIESLAEQKPLIYIIGNHELYGHTRQIIVEMRDLVRECKAPVHILEQESFVLEGVRFLGATLWSDLAAGGGLPRRAMQFTLELQITGGLPIRTVSSSRLPILSHGIEKQLSG